MQYRLTTTVELGQLGEVLKALDAWGIAPDEISRINGTGARATRRRIMSNTRGGQAILAVMTPGSVYTSQELSDALADKGLKKTSVASITSGLVREGRVVKLGKGMFRAAGAAP